MVLGGVLPNTLVSVRPARDGRGQTSLGNVLGSNTFDLLVVIPVGVLIVGAVPVNFSTASRCWACSRRDGVAVRSPPDRPLAVDRRRPSGSTGGSIHRNRRPRRATGTGDRTMGKRLCPAGETPER